MRKIKLTKEERAIEQSLEEFVPVSRHEYGEIVAAIEQRKKDAVLNIRINRYVPSFIRSYTVFKGLSSVMRSFTPGLGYFRESWISRRFL